MLRLFETFAGYGGASFALRKAGIDFECVGYSEVDKYAIKCYDQNHRKINKHSDSGNYCHRDIFDSPKNYGDITEIDPDVLPDFDLLTGGYPCQDVSVAGKGDLSKGRTTLFNEIIRIAEVKQPKFMLLENVKGLLSKRHRGFYEHTLKELDRIGYNVFKVYSDRYKEYRVPVLNTKDYGIPQNRERVWYVCSRKDIFFKFELPEKEELTLFLKDILEDNVDEKYYLSETQLKYLFSRNGVLGKSPRIDNSVAGCLLSSDLSKAAIQHLDLVSLPNSRQIVQVNNPVHSNDRVYDPNGISPTLNSMGGGNRQPFIVASRGRNLDNPSDRTTGISTTQRLEPKSDGTTNCISTVQKDNYVVMPMCDNVRIRKLTPTECFRLMGFLNDEINLDGLSNTRRYKLAGNGWDINVVSKIFERMFK